MRACDCTLAWVAYSIYYKWRLAELGRTVSRSDALSVASFIDLCRAFV